MRLAAGILLACCWLGGCERGPSASPGLSDEEIIAVLDKRLGPAACCFYVGESPEGESLYAPLKARRQIQFIVRRQVRGEVVSCGYSAFPPAKAFNGDPMASGFPAVFVTSGRRLYLQEDLPDETFRALQKDLCGPDWVESMPLVGVP